MATMRLHKFLAHAGVGSRRKCEELIAAGLITVDRETVTEMGRSVDPETQEIRYEGRRLRIEPRVHFAFNKPSGVVSTSSPKEKRPRVVDFFGKVPFRLYTAGRLDEDSEGLILVTNDGELAERVTHPRYGVPKTYRCRIRGRLEDSTIQQIRQGVWLAEGRTSPAHIHVLKLGREVSRIEITLFEGRNREVRRLFARFRHPVLELKRVRIGPIALEKLPRGAYRALTPKEVKELHAAASRGRERGRRPATAEPAGVGERPDRDRESTRPRDGGKRKPKPKPKPKSGPKKRSR